MQHNFVESNAIRLSKRFLHFGTPGIIISCLKTLFILAYAPVFNRLIQQLV